MKKIILTISCILLLCPSLYAKSISDNDGNDWNSWDISKKISYVKGFISASCFVSNNNDDDFRLILCDPKTTVSKVLCPDNSEREYNIRKKKNDVLKRYCITDISIGQLIDGLNLFYKDFRNRQIRLNLSVYIVRKQIEGAPNEEIETILLFLRKTFKESFYGGVPGLKYKDKSGIEHAIPFP